MAHRAVAACVLLAACTTPREGGTGVGNPPQAQVSLAAARGLEVHVASLPLAEVTTAPCGSRPVPTARDKKLELPDRVALGAGFGCGVTLVLDGPLEVRGTWHALGGPVPVDLSLDVQRIELTGSIELAPGQRVHMELGHPGWLDLARDLGAGTTVDEEHPAHAALVEALAQGSALFADARDDERLTVADRQQGPVAEGPEWEGPGAAGPAWFASQPASTWRVVASEGFAAVRPCATGDCPWSGAAGIGALEALSTAAVLDTTRLELQVIAQGGGEAYLGNEVYALDLLAEEPAWERLTEPSSAVVGGGDATYADGTLRAHQGHGTHVYHPELGALITGLDDMSPAGGRAPALATFDRERRAFEVGGLAELPVDHEESDGGAALDASTGLVWRWDAGPLARFHAYDALTDTWTVHAPSEVEPGARGAVDPARALLVLIDSASGLSVLDLADPDAAPAHPPTEGFGPERPRPGVVFHEGSDAWLVWGQADATQRIATLRAPAGDWRTEPWVWGELAGAGGEEPPPMAPGGVNGLFSLVPQLGGGHDALVLQTTPEDPPLVFKLP